MSQLERFSSIYARASERKGGATGLEALLSGCLSDDEIRQYRDAELLSAMSRQVFQSGFVASDATLIRHLKKTQAIYDNALMIHDVAREHGSLAQLIAAWPTQDIIGLWALLKKRGTRLGGNTGPYFLRGIGKDTFLLTDDVQGYFKAHKLVDAGFTSQTALKQVQAVFNQWQQESGRCLADISRILACSVGDNRILGRLDLVFLSAT